MKTLQLSDQKARSLHKTDSKEMRELLEENFGKDFFSQSVIDQIKTFQDAMEETGRPDVPDFSDVPEDMRAYFVAQYKMSVIAEALNEGWTPDWDNDNELKWRVWFRMSPSDFAFDTSSYDYSYARAGSGSRLYFKSEELVIYCAKQFIDIWRAIQLR